jgi:hypothetical protein
MTDHEVDISMENALRQSGLTADLYLSKALAILEGYGRNYKLEEAISLAHIMALDFNTTINAIKMQEIRDALQDIGNSLKDEEE